MQYFVTRNDFIKLEKQKKVTVKQLEELKVKLQEMFKRFKDQYKEING